MKIDNLSKYVSFLLLIMSGITTFKTWSWDERFKSIEIENKSTKIEQENISFDREFKFKIYDLTLKAIKSNDTLEQKAARLVVSSMVNDTIFKTGLLELFVKSNNISADVKDAAKVSIFDIQSSTGKIPSYSKKNKIYLDIFYYEENFEYNRTLAKKLRDALKTSDYYEVGLVKRFYKNDNAKPDYNIKENTIRYDADESAKAEILQQILNNLLSDTGISIEKEQTVSSKNQTNGYLSLFIMGDNSKQKN